jgi:hypothetical protein
MISIFAGQNWLDSDDEKCLPATLIRLNGGADNSWWPITVLSCAHRVVWDHTST